MIKNRIFTVFLLFAFSLQPALVSALSINVIPPVNLEGGQTIATYVVAANNTKNKDKADFTVPDGSTSAQSTINQAINALPASGGRVLLLDGTYIINGSIQLAGSKVTIEGMGAGTEIMIASGTNASFPMVAGPASGSDYTIRNITFNANIINNLTGSTPAGNNPGIQIASAISRLVISDNKFVKFNAFPAISVSNSSYVNISENFFRNASISMSNCSYSLISSNNINQVDNPDASDEPWPTPFTNITGTLPLINVSGSSYSIVTDNNLYLNSQTSRNIISIGCSNCTVTKNYATTRYSSDVAILSPNELIFSGNSFRSELLPALAPGGWSSWASSGVVNVGNGSGMLIGSNRFHSFRLALQTSTGSIVSNNISMFAIGSAFSVGTACDFCSFWGNSTWNASENGFVLRGSNSLYAYNTAWSSNYTSSTPSFDGYLLTDSTKSAFLGNQSAWGQHATNKPRYGLNISATASANLVTNNMLRESGVTGSLNNLGSGTVTSPNNRL